MAFLFWLLVIGLIGVGTLIIVMIAIIKLLTSWTYLIIPSRKKGGIG